MTQKRRNVIGIDMIRNNHIEDGFFKMTVWYRKGHFVMIQNVYTLYQIIV